MWFVDCSYGRRKGRGRWYVGGERGGEQRKVEGLAVILVCTCVYVCI